LYVFCGKQLLAAKLRRSNIDASAGAVEEVERVVAKPEHAGRGSRSSSAPIWASPGQS
jgi:hypothetical protein